MDAGSAPERIGQAHLPDQSPNFWRDAGPAGTPTGFPAPEGAKACPIHRITVSGSTIVMASRIRGAIRYKQTKIIRSKLLKTGAAVTFDAAHSADGAERVSLPRATPSSETARGVST